MSSENARAVRVGRGGLFYGWWIVAAGTVIIAVNSAFFYYGMAVFFTPLILEFGWSRTALSGVFSIARMQAGIAGPLAGIAIDRWGARRMVLIGLLFVATGFFLLARVYTLEAFYAVFILCLSVGTGLSASPPIGAALANWFVRRRGLAMGILMCGAGVGGFLATSLGWLIGAYGWRTTMNIMAGTVLLTGLPAAMVIRHRPQPYGLRPDGDPPGEPPAKPRSTIAELRRAGSDFPPAETLRTRAFYLLALVFGLRQLTTSGALIHLPALMVDRGYALETAAAIAGLVALVSIPGRLLCGWLADRVDQRYVFAASFVLLSASLTVLTFGATPLHVGLFVVGYGLSYGGGVPLMMSMVADYFGHRWYATTYGLIQFAMTWGNVAGPLVAGYAFDATGGYDLALHTFTLGNLLALVVVLLVRPPRRTARPVEVRPA